MKPSFAALRGMVLLPAIAGLMLTTTSATEPDRPRTAGEMVEVALRLGIEGDHADRRELLESALEQMPDYGPARWHSGYVRYDDAWLKFDELPDLTAGDQRLSDYRRLRKDTPETVAGHLALARWCLEHELLARSRGHLGRALDLDPENREARRLLRDELHVDAFRSRQEPGARQAALCKWEPKIESILRGLSHASKRQRQTARDRLLAIDDPEAIPALEAVFASHGGFVATLTLDVLAGMPAPEASLALARQAVFSPSNETRKAAVERLDSRDLFSYVPALLEALRTPVESPIELAWGPDHERDFPRLTVRAPVSDAAIAEHNARTDDRNGRICRVLSQVTGRDLGTSPGAWWKWWDEYNEVFVPDDRPFSGGTLKFSRADGYQLWNHQGVTYARRPGGTWYRHEEGRTWVMPPGESWSEWKPRASCLLAGTLVWSDSGPRPIEQIQVGDLVLSQSPETGELAYKPVVKTTVRPPVRMVKIVFGGQALQSSGGHPFWVTGKGWVFARDLEEGVPLHTVDGTAPVRSVHPTGSEELHNLVVADFHTYFVTEAKILTHDNTMREPTTALVPGLVSR